MFAVPVEEVETRKVFASKLEVYRHAVDTNFYRLDVHDGQIHAPVEEVRVPQGDLTHVFDNGGMLAISHAIEDLANGTDNGEFIATFQDLKNFEPRKKRYVEMAKHLDAVRIWGHGKIPSRCPGIDFVPVFHPEVLRYWVVMFTSEERHAILVGKQINQANDVSKKIFVGFYSLNPFVVHHLRKAFTLLSSGLAGAIQTWEARCNFPEIPSDELKELVPEPHLKENLSRPRTIAHD